MKGLGKYVWTTLAVAVLTHIVLLYGFPHVLMSTVMGRVAQGHWNAWHMSARVTETSRTIVRPSPDLAYSVCPYDLGRGPLIVRVAPWSSYWSLSFYQDNSDNFYVLDDREARGAAVDLALVKKGAQPPAHVAQVVESASARGLILIRRLAPTQTEYNAAAEAAKSDVCSTFIAAAN